MKMAIFDIAFEPFPLFYVSNLTINLSLPLVIIDWGYSTNGS